MWVTGGVGARVPALLLALGGLAACGSGSGPAAERAADSSSEGLTASTATAESGGARVPAGTPRCDSVWRDGARIPRGYRGCVEGGGLVGRDVLGCSSGQRLVRHADRFYGVLGGTVHEAAGPLERDRDYLADVRSCRG